MSNSSTKHRPRIGKNKSLLSLAFISMLFLGMFNQSFAQALTQAGFVSVSTPQFMPAGTSTRLPIMYRATVTGLTPNTEYRYFTQAATNASTNGASLDFGLTNPGAGNSLLINAAGTTYTLTTNPSLTTVGAYESFTTDATGNYTAWFGFTNTGNGRFTAGNLVYPTIVIGSNTGVVQSRRALDVSITVLGFAATANATSGSFLKGTGSLAIAKNVVAIYSNLDGTGRPLFISPVESIGVTIASVVTGYSTATGSWNAIIPNTNPDGVRRIEQLSITTGLVVGCAKDSNGVWPTGSVNTVNPNAGTTGITIAGVDAPINTCCNVIAVSASAAPISCPGGATTVTVSATGGVAPYTGTGTFNVGSGSYTYNVTDANGCPGSTSINIAAAVDTLKPAIYLLQSRLLAGLTGPSTTQTPYLKPSKLGVRFGSVLSVNDVIGGYRMAGIPDGLGAFDNGDGTFTLLMNHEIGTTLGVVRAHGSIGAFVSKWVIRKSDFAVLSGSDLMRQLYLWDPATSTFNLGTFAFGRFCSADLPAISAFYNSSTGLGTTERIFMDGEETGVEGKAVGHIITGASAGVSYELPYLGKFAWENSVASPASGNKTVVAGMDDGTGGQVYIYVGNKTNTGTDIDKAGLNNGRLYGIKVVGLPLEVNASVPAVGTRFQMADMGFVQNKTGAALNTESVAAGVTTFMRPEDGSWDPKHPNDFYFATTNAFNAPTRLWRLRFDNVASPETGGTIEAVLDGTEGAQMFDNITVDKFGHIMLVEDVGNNAHIGRVFQYNTATDVLTPIAYHDSTRFLIGGANFLTQDEESSGILDMSEILGPGMYFTDVQAHYQPAANTAEVVEGGQLLVMYNPNVFGASTAPDTVRVSIPFGSTTATSVNLGTPSTADDCSVASLNNNAPSTYPLGTTIVTWTVTDGSGNTATVNQVVIVSTAANVKPAVSITSPTNNSSSPAGSTVTVNATATDVDGSVTAVALFYNGIKLMVDSTSPYQFVGTNVEAGDYLLNAIAYDDRGDSTISDTVKVVLTACTGTGYISAQGYLDIPGNRVVDLTNNSRFPNSPDVSVQLDRFEYGPNFGDNYGGRLSGYICAPLSGNYTFYIASDEQSELWLSTNEDPANKVRIAYLAAPVPFRSFTSYFTQKSAPIFLVKGARYYIESLHKEGVGADHLSVGWVLPNGSQEGPIPGSRLTPFVVAPASAARQSFATAFQVAQQKIDEVKGVEKLTVTAMMNPSNSTFQLRIRSNSNKPVSILLTDASGHVLEKMSGISPNSTVEVGKTISAGGLYVAEVQQDGKKERVKLIRQ